MENNYKFEDVVLTVTGNDTVDSVKIGSATVNTSNYTVDGGTITLKKEYLSTLAVGDKVFTLLFGTNNLVVTVTILDTTE